MYRSDMLKKKLIANGASLVGFADLGSMDDRPFNNYPFAISIAVALDPEIVLQITKGPTVEYCGEYERVNQVLDNIADCAVTLIESQGYKAKTLSATDRKYVEGAFLTSIFSHKKAATISGLGWIGKNDLLITKEFGSAVRFNTVFTDMPLVSGKPITLSFCGTCDACVKACPVSAPRSINWFAGLHRDELLDINTCYLNAKEMSGKIAVEPIICGICIAACPWTKKYIKKACNLQNDNENARTIQPTIKVDPSPSMKV